MPNTDYICYFLKYAHSCPHEISQGGIAVGPDSVGKDLTSKALVFEGGETMTSTDIAVASGFCEDIDIGDKERVKHIPEDVRIGSLKDIKRKIEAAIDRMKVRVTFN